MIVFARVIIYTQSDTKQPPSFSLWHTFCLQSEVQFAAKSCFDAQEVTAQVHL